MSTPGGRNVPKANNDMKTPATSQPSETSNRTLLKVYMANQLELNEADMESYEAVVNELAEQLTEVTRIKNELTMNIIQLHNEKDEMIREKTEEWSEQKSELVMQINELQGSIDEINMVRFKHNHFIATFRGYLFSTLHLRRALCFVLSTNCRAMLCIF